MAWGTPHAYAFIKRRFLRIPRSFDEDLTDAIPGRPRLRVALPIALRRGPRLRLPVRRDRARRHGHAERACPPELPVCPCRDRPRSGDARGAPGQHTALGTRLTPPPASFTGGRRSDPPFR